MDGILTCKFFIEYENLAVSDNEDLNYNEIIEIRYYDIRRCKNDNTW